jgi:hypothetical protein
MTVVRGLVNLQTNNAEDAETPIIQPTTNDTNIQQPTIQTLPTPPNVVNVVPPIPNIYQDLELTDLFPNINLKNSLKSHYDVHSIVLKLTAFIKKMHSYEKLRLDPELTTLILNIIKG